MLQAAKVISAHAASVGDPLLGVPLHCAAGLNADATVILQDAGLWRYAATLVARTLSGVSADSLASAHALCHVKLPITADSAPCYPALCMHCCTRCRAKPR